MFIQRNLRYTTTFILTLSNFDTNYICDLYIPLAIPDDIIGGEKEGQQSEIRQMALLFVLSSSFFFFCKARVICLGYYGALQLVKLVVVSFNLSTKLTSRAPHHPHLHCIECTFAQFSRIYNKGMTECSIQQSDMIYNRVIEFGIQNQIWFYLFNRQCSLDNKCIH